MYNLSMQKKHHIFLIPGLDDRSYFFKLALKRLYNDSDTISHVEPFGFMNRSSTFEKQLSKYMNYIRPLLKNKNATVSLIGVSAGASASINIWQEFKKEKLYTNGGIVNICGRLIDGKAHNAIPTLSFSTRRSKIFFESVIRAERYIKKLTKQEKSQIMTFRALFDEVVPSSTIQVDEATNIQVPMAGHIFTITTTVLLYSKKIMSFIKKLNVLWTA
jgi:hypothetical protein